MRYVRARIGEDEEAQTFRIYATDALMNIAENTARFVSGGKYLSRRWIELFEDNPVDTRSGDEIAIDVLQRSGARPRQ